jgi:hypothetical protein
MMRISLQKSRILRSQLLDQPSDFKCLATEEGRSCVRRELTRMTVRGWIRASGQVAASGSIEIPAAGVRGVILEVAEPGS